MTQHPDKKRVAVLASGTGTNTRELIAAASAPDYPAEIALIIANHGGAGVLCHVTKDLPGLIIVSKGRSAEEFEALLDDALMRHTIDLVCLAGFELILSPAFVAKWRGKMLNIHPAPLAKYPAAGGKGMVGKAVQRKMYELQATEWGCTVHFVTPEVDGGPIVVTGLTPARKNTSLAANQWDFMSTIVLGLEHQAYPQALRMVASGDYLLNESGQVVGRGGVLLPPEGIVIR